MFFVLALALTGLLLIFLEFFLPGAIMAIGGTLLLMASLFVYYMTYPIDLYFLIYFVGLSTAVYLTIRLGMQQTEKN